jgi:hypothetical protein
LFRTFDTPINVYSGASTKESLMEFLTPLLQKTIIDIKGENVDDMFDHATTTLMLFRHLNQTDLPFMKIYEEAAKKYKGGKIQFAYMDGEDDIADQFATQFMKVVPADYPTLRAIFFKEPNDDQKEPELEADPQPDDDIQKYRFGGNENDDTEKMTVETIKEFIDNIFAQKIDKFIKSQPVPENNDSPV